MTLERLIRAVLKSLYIEVLSLAAVIGVQLIVNRFRSELVAQKELCLAPGIVKRVYIDKQAVILPDYLMQSTSA